MNKSFELSYHLLHCISHCLLSTKYDDIAILTPGFDHLTNVVQNENETKNDIACLYIAGTFVVVVSTMNPLSVSNAFPLLRMLRAVANMRDVLPPPPTKATMWPALQRSPRASFMDVQ
jgi:hypothetical protein